MFSRHVLKPENVVVEIIHYRCTYVVPGCCAYVCARFQKEKENKTKQPDTSEFYAEKLRIEDPLERRALSIRHHASARDYALLYTFLPAKNAHYLYWGADHLAFQDFQLRSGSVSRGPKINK